MLPELEIDLMHGKVRRGDLYVKLPRQSLALFVRLYEANGAIVTRNQLKSAAWDASPSYDVFAQAMCKLRLAITPLFLAVGFWEGRGYYLHAFPIGE